MSWESERARDPGAQPAPRLAPLVVGFVLGLVATGGTPFVYYWLFAPIFPIMAGIVVVLLAIKFKQLWPVAEGLFAAAFFGVAFVLVAFAGLGTLLSR